MSSNFSSTTRSAFKPDDLSQTQDDTKNIQFSKNFCHNIKSETVINKIACFTCRNISTIPKMCSSCNTVYCYYCSKRYEAEKINKCPKCKKSLDLIKLNSELNETLKNLKIRCLNNLPNQENTCKEILSLGDLLDHFNTCSYSKGYAKCMGCDKEGLYEEIITHTYLCEEVIIKCSICSEKIKKKFFESHEKKCLETIIKCPICELECKAMHFEEHKSKDMCLIRKIEEIKQEFNSKIEDMTKLIKEKDKKLNLFEEKLTALENEKINNQIIYQDNKNSLKEEDIEFKRKIIENNKRFSNELNNIRDNIFQIKTNINEIQGKLEMNEINSENKIILQNNNNNNNSEKNMPMRSKNLSNDSCNLTQENPLTIKMNNLKCVKSIDAHSSVIYNLKELKTKINDRNAIASSGGDNLIKIWSMDDFRNLATLEGHSDQILSFCEIKRLDNKNLLLSASEDKKIILWDLSIFKLIKVFENTIHTNRIWRIKNFNTHISDVNLSNCMISCGDDKTIKIFNYTTEKINLKIDNGNDKLTCLLQYNTFKEKYQQENNSVFNNIHFLVSGDTGRKLKLWKLNYIKKNSNSQYNIEAQLINSLEFHNNYVSEIKKIKWKKDLFTIASASADETIKIIDLASSSCLFTLKGHVDRIYCLAPILSADKNLLNESASLNSEKVFLASGGKDKTIKIWDIQTGMLIKTLKDHEDNIRSLLVLRNKTLLKTTTRSKDEKDDPYEFTLLSAGSDSQIKIWSS